MRVLKIKALPVKRETAQVKLAHSAISKELRDYRHGYFAKVRYFLPQRIAKLIVYCSRSRAPSRPLRSIATSLRLLTTLRQLAQ
jgi:hypothetical protein